MAIIVTFSEVVSVTPGDRGRSFIFTGSSLGAWRLPALASVPRGYAVGLRNSGPANVQAVPRNLEVIEGLNPSAAYTHVPFSGAVYVAEVSLWRQSMLFAPGGVPTGGTEGQVLRKLGVNNYDDEWQDAPMTLSPSFPGTPTALASVGALMTEAGTFPANFAGSFARAKIASTGTVTFSIKINSTTIGTATFTSSTTGTLATVGGGAIAFDAGDLVDFIAPASPDATLADIAFGLRAIRA